MNKLIKKDGIPILISKLKIYDYEIKQLESLTFLGVLLDKHLTWKPHIKYIENEIGKNIGLLYKVKP